MKKLQIVKHYQDANVLLSKGYTINYIDRDINDRSKLIFWFNYTEGIKDDLEKLNRPKGFRHEI